MGGGRSRRVGTERQNCGAAKRKKRGGPALDLDLQNVVKAPGDLVEREIGTAPSGLGCSEYHGVGGTTQSRCGDDALYVCVGGGGDEDGRRGMGWNGTDGPPKQQHSTSQKDSIRELTASIQGPASPGESWQRRRRRAWGWAVGSVRHAIIIVAIRKPCFPVFPVSQRTWADSAQGMI